MIRYTKMIERFKAAGITSYTLRKDGYNGIGQATWQKIQQGGNIDTRTIDAACRLLHCQPGDLMEYVEDACQAVGQQGEQ